MLLPVILAGGSGSRLWPLSRQFYPKQLIPLIDNQSMLQATVARLKGLNAHKPLVVSNEEYRFMTAEQLRAVNALNQIILEPEGRNTAPAICLAALQAQRLYPDSDPSLLILASDHVIGDKAAFQRSVKLAQHYADKDKLVTFGIEPSSAHTGYGYIRAGTQAYGAQGEQAYWVNEFVEKPNASTAQAYIDAGNYYWNSGMFMFKASRYLSALKHCRPDIYSACLKAMEAPRDDLDFIRVNARQFSDCPSESIDYAIMEPLAKANQKVLMVPLNAQWSDVGSWSALWELQKKDAQGNSFNGDVLDEGSQNCFVNAPHKLVATLGLENTVIIDTKDALLVAHKDKVQKVKSIVSRLKAAERSEALNHREVYRPWGKYDAIDHGHRYQVKRITVKPKEKLSVQMHHHRAEHWIVVKGTAKVTNGEETFLVTENQSTYIPIGTVHALENPGKVPLELIEVQSGSYLGEDDIIRFDDRYGRENEEKHH